MSSHGPCEEQNLQFTSLLQDHNPSVTQILCRPCLTSSIGVTDEPQSPTVHHQPHPKDAAPSSSRDLDPRPVSAGSAVSSNIMSVDSFPSRFPYPYWDLFENDKTKDKRMLVLWWTLFLPLIGIRHLFTKSVPMAILTSVPIILFSPGYLLLWPLFACAYLVCYFFWAACQPKSPCLESIGCICVTLSACLLCICAVCRGDRG